MHPQQAQQITMKILSEEVEGVEGNNVTEAQFRQIYKNILARMEQQGIKTAERNPAVVKEVYISTEEMEGESGRTIFKKLWCRFKR